MSLVHTFFIPRPLRERAWVKVGQYLKNSLQHCVHVHQYVVIPKAKHSITTPFQISRPPLICLGLRCMLATIEFDHQPTFNRTKISDERADRMLSTKLCIAELSVAQPRPEFAFRIGLLAPQPASSELLRAWIRQHEICPHPDPLPQVEGIRKHESVDFLYSYRCTRLVL